MRSVAVGNEYKPGYLGWMYFVLSILTLLSLYWLSKYNYLLFHSFVEIFSIIISCCVFILSIFTPNKEKNAFSILGIGFLVVGIIDLLHALSYQGMNIFETDIFYANQLWICARFIEAVAIFVFLIQTKRKAFNYYASASVYVISLVIVVLTIFYFKVFPICFIEGYGQTQFKIYSEYVICLILATSFVLLKFKNYIDNKQINNYFSASILAAILSELSFTLYTDNYGFLNIIGHLLKIVSFYFIYKSILLVNVQNPLALIFEELNKKINEARLLNEKLHQSEEKYKSKSEELELIIDHIPGLVFYKDKNNTYIKVNKYVADAHKKEKKDLEGESLYNLYSKDAAESYHKDDLLVINSGKPRLNIEEPWDTELGRKWVNTSKIPFINTKGEALGVIGISMDITDKKKAEEKALKLLEELKQEKEAALEKSIVDGLTGIYNRRHFNEVLNKEYFSARRGKYDLSIAMIDIDYFKNYNDHYGHVMGDECLIKVANILKVALRRATDTIARYGGEEFIAIFQNTNKKGALVIANKLREAVYDLNIEHEKSDCAKYVTVSIGVFTINGFIFEKPEEMIGLADKALYIAKNNGRNRIEFYE